MKAVIIAGGKGERLRPVTFETAKALIKVKGQTLIDHAINLFWNNQTYEIWLSLGHRAQEIREKFSGLPFWLDRHSTDNYVIPLGTGGWLNRLAKTNGRDYWDDDFFVCNADNLFSLNLKEMMEQHIDDNNVVTIACTKVKDVRDYGSVAIRGKKVMNFEEKKKSRVKKSGWINGGYYIFSPKVFDYVEKLGIDIDDTLSLERDLFPILAKEKVLGAYKSDGQWFDTGTFERWEKAIKEWGE